MYVAGLHTRSHVEIDRSEMQCHCLETRREIAITKSQGSSKQRPGNPAQPVLDDVEESSET